MFDEDRLRIVAIERLRNGYVPRTFRQLPCSLIEVFARHTDQHADSMVDCGTEGLSSEGRSTPTIPIYPTIRVVTC